MSEENTEARDVIDFNVNDARIAEVATKFKDVDAHTDLPGAKVAKKTLVKMRSALGEAHKIQKADSLAFGRRLDGEKNRLLELIADIEDPISKQLKEIKEAEENKEAIRVEAINAAIERIRAFPNDRHDLTLEQLEERRATLRTIEITEETFQEFLDQAQTFHDEADAKLRIAIINETERLADEARATARAEEDRVRQEAMDKQQADLDAKAEEIRKIEELAAEKVRAEQEKKDAERQAALDAQAAAQKVKDDEQAAAQAAIDKQNREYAEEKAAQEAAEEKQAADAAAEEARLAAAPDVEKLVAYADALATTVVPHTTTDVGNRVRILAVEKLEAVIAYIRNEAEKLK